MIALVLHMKKAERLYGKLLSPLFNFRWNTFQLISFHVIFSSFSIHFAVLQFLFLLLDIEYGHFQFMSEFLKNIAYFRSYPKISVSKDINAKCR